jgi:hypothetical protein
VHDVEPGRVERRLRRRERRGGDEEEDREREHGAHDARRQQRRRHEEAAGGYRDAEERWPGIQDEMDDAMVWLERAFRPRFDVLPS